MTAASMEVSLKESVSVGDKRVWSKSQHGLRRSALYQGRLCPLPEVSGSRQQNNELIRIIAII